MISIKCIIIDDESVAIDILADYVEKVKYLELISTFRSSLKALDFVKSFPIDLIFLDINMPDLTGIQFLNSLDHQSMIIFTTAYSQYAVKSYDFEAVDYLLKPIEFERFLKAAGRAYSRYVSQRNDKIIDTSRSDSILIKSGTEFHRISIRDILYIKSAGNYVIFVTNDKKIMTLLRMQDVLAILPETQFFRIHRSYIVAFHQIDVIEKERVKLKNISLPIGDAYRDSFLQKIFSTDC